MSALASCGRQAHDDQLVKTAMRVQLRALRRAGEILQQMEIGRGRNQYSEDRVGDHPTVGKANAARDAGFSDYQRKNALRIANIPEDESHTVALMPWCRALMPCRTQLGLASGSISISS